MTTVSFGKTFMESPLELRVRGSRGFSGTKVLGVVVTVKREVWTPPPGYLAPVCC